MLNCVEALCLRCMLYWLRLRAQGLWLNSARTLKLSPISVWRSSDVDVVKIHDLSTRL